MSIGHNACGRRCTSGRRDAGHRLSESGQRAKGTTRSIGRHEQEKHRTFHLAAKTGATTIGISLQLGSSPCDPLSLLPCCITPVSFEAPQLHAEGFHLQPSDATFGIGRVCGMIPTKRVYEYRAAVHMMTLCKDERGDSDGALDSPQEDEDVQ